MFIYSKLIKYGLQKSVFILFFALFYFTCPCFAENLRIHFIDVGKGDAILIQTPADKSILIDTGNLITGFKVVRYLEKKNIYKLDHLIFTHPDLDHTGGAFFVLQMIDVKEIYCNEQDLSDNSKSFDVYRWHKELIESHDHYNILKSGDKLTLDEITLKILWPPKQLISSDFNVNSLVIMLEYKGFKCLLTGDLNILAENELIKEGADLKADVLKIGHHGADDASSKEFLEKVSPKISIISTNIKDIHDYPSKNVLQRLKTLNSEVYRTDKHGDIVVEIDKNEEMKILPEKVS